MAAKSERRGLRAPVADSRRTIRPLENEPRERDERFHSLLRLSTGFYWETDARHRLTKVIRGPRSVTPWRPKGQIGKTRWELPSTHPDQAGWQAHLKTLDRHLPFRDFEYARPMPDGTERHYRISGEPIFADDKTFRGYRGVGHDITELKLAESALRQSEARFRSLTELSSDWYWEQDEQFRTTFMSAGLAEKTGIDVKLYLGQKRWDLPALNLTDADWARHRAQLQRHQPFFDFEMQRAAEGGRTMWLSISGAPVFDAEGRFRGYRGIGRHITERKRSEQLLRLEHSVARCLADARNVAEALKAVMRAVCESEGWQCGRYFQVDATANVLRFAGAWSVPDAAIERFLAESATIVYHPGSGLAGRVWQTGEPVWSSDTSNDPRVLQARLARDSGIRGAFVFPVMSEGRTIGVMAFSSNAIRNPDERLLQSVRVIGSQIGQFLKRKQAEEALRESEERFRSLTHMSSDFFWESDGEHRLTQVVHGPNYSPIHFQSSIIGKTLWEMPSSKPDAAAWAAHKATMDAHLPFRDFEYARPPTDGATRHLSISGEPHFAADGAFLGYRGVGRDVTELVDARERIASLAFNDALTGLANRTSLGPALEHAVQIARRHERKLAMLFIDLDGFKQINDAHGHDIGDRLLIEFANRLRACVRTSDFVARLGGDEFVVLLEEIRDRSHVEAVARKLLAEIGRPHALVAGEDLRITASIGISMFPEDGGDPRALMKNADTAMNRAKEKGKNAICFYGEPPDPSP